MTNHITLIIACIGAILGIINTWYMFRRDKVKLKVLPIHTLFGNSEKKILKLGLKVVNLSYFPISVSDIGFRYAIKGYNLMHGVDHKGEPLPLRLSSRASYTFYLDSPEALWGDDYNGHCYAYAMTACGRIFRGKSDAILSIKNSISHNFDDFMVSQKI